MRCKLVPFLKLMYGLAELSTCRRPDSKVGCVIIQPDFSEVVAIGYNGPAAGEGLMACRGPDAVGGCGCIHAEANAVAKLRTRDDGLVCLITKSPCEHCAGMLINTRRIDAVIYSNAYRDLNGVDRLRRAGVLVHPLEAVFPVREMFLFTPRNDPPGETGKGS